jgi:hypothetical protein
LAGGLVGETQFQQIRSTMLFMPDDIYDLQPSPKPDQAIPVSRTIPPLRQSSVIRVRDRKVADAANGKKEKILSIQDISKGY